MAVTTMGRDVTEDPVFFRAAARRARWLPPCFHPVRSTDDRRMATVSKVPRMLNLVAALRSSPTPMTAEELRVRVPGYAVDASDETFRRAFERDKDELRRIGIPIDTVTAQHHEQLVAAYTIRKEAYDLPDPKLTPEELAALHLAATSVRLEGLDEEVAAFRKLGGLGGESGGERDSGRFPCPTT